MISIPAAMPNWFERPPDTTGLNGTISRKWAYAKARELVLANRDSLTNWGDVPYGQRKAMLEDLNRHLEEQRVLPVSDEVWHWKCSQIMPKMIREVKKADILQEEQKSDTSGSGNQAGTVEGLPADNGIREVSETGAPACVPSDEPSMHHSIVTAPIQEVGIEAMVDDVGRSVRAEDSRERPDITPSTPEVSLGEASTSPPLQLPPIQLVGWRIDDRGQNGLVEITGIKDLLRSADEQNRPPPARSSIHDLLSH